MQAANEAKSQFLATRSHEMRTPLNAVLGLAQLVADTPLSPEQRAFVAQIRASARSLLGLINDILDLTKVEAGKLELAAVPFDLRDAVEETAHLLAHRAAEKGLELGVHVDPGLDTAVVGDPDRLRQILLNLVANGVKFTAAGGVSVTVAAGGEAAGGRRVFRFEVRDTGIGISAEGQRKLFGRFSQVRRLRAAVRYLDALLQKPVRKTN